MKAYNNYAAITGTDSNEHLQIDEKMSFLSMKDTPDVSKAWSVQYFADNIRQAFLLNENDKDVIYSFMSDEFFIWKYGFNKHI